MSNTRPAPAAPRLLVRIAGALLVLVAIVAGIAEYLVDDATASWVASIAWTAAGTAAIGGLTHGARRVDGPLARRAWGMLAVAAGCWLAGQLIYDVYPLTSRTPSIPSLADVPWVIFGGVAIVALHAFMPFAREIRNSRRSMALDSVALYAIVAVLAVIVFYDRASHSQVGLLTKITAITYAALYSAVVVAFGQAVFRRNVLSRHPKLLALGAGVVLQAIAFLLWTPRLLAGDYVIGKYPTDACWTAGMLCLGLAGLLASRGQALEVPRAEDLRRRALLPAVAFGIGLLLLPVLVMVDATIPVRLILQGGIIVAGTCFIARVSLLSRSEREADSEARAARDELDRFFAISAEMLAIMSFDGHLLRVNPAVERESGYTAAELASRPLLDLMHPADRPALTVALTELRRGAESTSFDCRLRARDSRYLALRMSATASPAHGVAYVVARDLTERNRVEAVLRAAHTKAVEASQMKSNFLANMSHEIRTPLNGVIGMTELLRDSALTEEQTEYTEAIRASGDALLTVINDILDFSKIEAGKLDIEAGDFDPRESVEGVCAMVAATAGGKGVEVVAAIDDSCPELVRGDAARFRQVLANLVTNAVKFTAEGDVVIRTAVERIADRTWLQVTVSDTGVGIEPATLGRLFEAFEQADASTTRRYGGTGLGLAISTQLVELMGGEIGARSTPGEGSTFWFTMPVEAAHGSAPTAPQPDIEGMRVLVVDDNETNRAILEHQLRSWATHCDTAADGTQALALLNLAADTGRPYELVLLDFHMPRLDGREVVRAMRLSPRLRRTRVVFLTSSVERRAARAAGVDGYLTKPVRRAQLRDEIRRVMTSPDARRAASPAVVEDVSAGEGALVLVVEDQLVNQRVAVGLLERRGLHVEVAGDGRRALEMHAARPYAAIFMDCQLPEIDGYEATAEIRRREGSGRRTPIIAMTAHALKGDRERCVEAGMDDYLSKPLRPADIDAVLARMLDGEGMAAPAAEAPAVPAETPVLDRALLRDVCGADEHAVADLTDLFIDQTQDGVTRLGLAIDAADLEAVRRIAHGLKGSSSAVGALRLSAACDQLSHATSADDLAVAGEAQSLIEHVFALTRSALTSPATQKETH